MIYINKNGIPEKIKKQGVFIYGGGYTGEQISIILKNNGVKIHNVIDDEGLQRAYIVSA